jgi:hypothetical protein
VGDESPTGLGERRAIEERATAAEARSAAAEARSERWLLSERLSSCRTSCSCSPSSETTSPALSAAKPGRCWLTRLKTSASESPGKTTWVRVRVRVRVKVRVSPGKTTCRFIARWSA